MSALLRSELLKLQTTRTTWVLIAIALAIILGTLILILALFNRGGSVSDEDLGTLFTFTATADLLILSLGIVGAAGEFRHGTVTGSFLVTPARWPVFVAKAGAYALVGLAYALATVLLILVVALPWLAAKDAQFELGGGAWVTPLLGRIAYATLSAVLGVALGTLFRNQAAALVTALVFLLAIDPAISAIWDPWATYGIGGASVAMFGAGDDLGGADTLSVGAGTALYALYCIAFLAAGIALAQRRDVS